MTVQDGKISWRIMKEIEEKEKIREKRKEFLVSKPERIGYFSVDDDKCYLDNSSKLLYYKPPSDEYGNFDLNRDTDSIPRITSFVAKGMDLLLEWIKRNRTTIEAPVDSGRLLEPQFVCTRGFLRELACTEFVYKHPWTIFACKLRGTIYLLMTANNLDVFTDDMILKDIWGRKFHQYMLADAPDKRPISESLIRNNGDFRCVFRRNYGEHKLIYSAQMDAVRSNIQLTDPLPLKDLEFVDLKTTNQIHSDKQKQQFFRYKLLNWWSQGSLSNTGKLCGFRNDAGIVGRLKYYSLEDMILLSKGYWDPKTCENYCVNFFTDMSKIVIDECDSTIYKIEKKEREMTYVTTKLSASSENSFIPAWYSDEINKHSASTSC